MIPFLKQVAKQIIENHENNTEDIYILVPNRRAILYLKHYLSELSGRPIWTPKMYSIEDFIFTATRYQKSEPIDLLFELYTIHRNIAENDTRSFDHFIQWGEQLLNDFNDIDFYLADASAVFSYLSDAKAMERWHIDGSDLTENERKYLEFYRSLITYYQLLKEKIQIEKKAWTGLAYRLFHENFNMFFTSFFGKPFYIVGFNALTKVEEEIFKNIRRNTPTTFLWDADEYYVKNPHHEAGIFLRKHSLTFGIPIELVQNFKSTKNITITGIAKNVGQMIFTGSILAQIPEITTAPDDTAIILNDERLLLPMLDFIPERFTNFNVTMGYPINHTLPYHLIILWIQMHLTAATVQSKSYCFKKEFIFDFFQHPLLKDLLSSIMPSKATILDKNISTYYKESNPYVNIYDIEQKIFAGLSETFSKLKFAFEPWDNNNKETINKIRQMVSLLQDFLSEKNDVVNLESLFYLSKAVNRLSEINEKYDTEITIQSISLIINRIFRNIKIPFSGEPIGGLQVMGMLETRLLDYKNIILLSVNEGIIPSKKSNTSFIPFDIRRHFSLPTHHDNHAVTAYHFYRLLQRAENIHILYNTDSGSGVGAKEKSRFITQLLYELPKYNPNTKIIEQHTPIETTSSPPTLNTLTIPKTTFAIKRLNEIALQGFSPSAINDYLRCPVDFYLKRIAKIPDPLQFSDAIDSATFGTIIHETIYKTHEHLIKKLLVTEDINPIFDTFEFVLEESFKKNWTGGDYHKGKNLLTFIAAQDYVRSFLTQQRNEIKAANDQNIPYSILLQEKELSATLKLELNDEKKSILFKGYVDRVVKIGKTFRIIDFKTGNVANSEIKIKDSSRFLKEKYSPKAIQLLAYAWMIHQSKTIPDSCELETGIISFRRINDGFLPLSIADNSIISDEILATTMTILTNIMQELFNPDIPFIASSDPKAHTFSQFEILY